MPDPSITPLLNSTVSSGGFVGVNGTYGAQFVNRCGRAATGQAAVILL